MAAFQGHSVGTAGHGPDLSRGPQVLTLCDREPTRVFSRRGVGTKRCGAAPARAHERGAVSKSPLRLAADRPVLPTLHHARQYVTLPFRV